MTYNVEYFLFWIVLRFIFEPLKLDPWQNPKLKTKFMAIIPNSTHFSLFFDSLCWFFREKVWKRWILLQFGLVVIVWNFFVCKRSHTCCSKYTTIASMAQARAIHIFVVLTIPFIWIWFIMWARQGKNHIETTQLLIMTYCTFYIRTSI